MPVERALVFWSSVGLLSGAGVGLLDPHYVAVAVLFGSITGVSIGSTVGPLLGAILMWQRLPSWAARFLNVSVPLALFTLGVIWIAPTLVTSKSYVLAAGATALIPIGLYAVPLLERGVRPDASGPFGQFNVIRAAVTVFGACVVIGGAGGAVTGFVIGLDYPLTAIFAAIEGGIFGLAGGAALGVLAVGVLIMPFARPRELADSEHD